MSGWGRTHISAPRVRGWDAASRADSIRTSRPARRRTALTVRRTPPSASQESRRDLSAHSVPGIVSTAAATSLRLRPRRHREKKYAAARRPVESKRISVSRGKNSLIGYLLNQNTPDWDTHRYGTGSGSDLVLALCASRGGARSLPLPVPYRCRSLRRERLP